MVGAGSAGSVFASRLSKDGKASVLLLEAGRGEPWFSAIPMLAPLLQQTDYVWPYLMEHQPGVCMGMVYFHSIMKLFLCATSISNIVKIRVF